MEKFLSDRDRPLETGHLLIMVQYGCPLRERGKFGGGV
jgi:hypothetical protein